MFFHFCGNSSVGRARPCQGRGREFESRLPLKKEQDYVPAFFLSKAPYRKEKGSDNYGVNLWRKNVLSKEAQVAELVDAYVSGAYVARRAGSSPVLGTKVVLKDF